MDSPQKDDVVTMVDVLNDEKGELCLIILEKLKKI